jgi:hypothetical protein
VTPGRTDEVRTEKLDAGSQKCVRGRHHTDYADDTDSLGPGTLEPVPMTTTKDAKIAEGQESGREDEGGE